VIVRPALRVEADEDYAVSEFRDTLELDHLKAVLEDVLAGFQEQLGLELCQRRKWGRWQGEHFGDGSGWGSRRARHVGDLRKSSSGVLLRVFRLEVYEVVNKITSIV
jgi:hypothetical protein